MKTHILFSFPGLEALSAQITEIFPCEVGRVTIRHFPDEESYVRVLSEVKDKEALILCTLDRPDSKLLPLLFLARTLRQLGASRVTLIAPYLAYMRQDRRFHEGEAITSQLFADLISHMVDHLITIDPHLHRRSGLDEIYTIPSTILHAADHVATWVRQNVKDPLIIGPDSESEQWASIVAEDAAAPYIVLDKERHGDRDVEIKVPDLSKYKGRTPVLVDDIISTARTMITAASKLKDADLAAPVCVGVHGVFAEGAYEALKEQGAQLIATCGTIPHASNQIQIADLIVQGLT